MGETGKSCYQAKLRATKRISSADPEEPINLDEK